MKTRSALYFGMIFVMIFTLTFANSAFAGYSFWYGTDITEVKDDTGNILLPGISKESAQGLHDDVRNRLANLQSSLFRFTNNPDREQGRIIWQEDKTWNGYTLLSALRGYTDPNTGKTYNTLLVDMEGNLIQKWELTAFPAKMLPNGSVIGGKGAFQELVGVPYLVQQDWNGNEEWRWNGNANRAWQAERNWMTSSPTNPQPVGNGRCGLYNDVECDNAITTGEWIKSGWHHDFQREGSSVGYYHPFIMHHKHPPYKGKTLILSNYLPKLSETSDISDFRLYGDAIYEIGWDGRVLFEWFCYEHYHEMGFSPSADESIKTIRGGAYNTENATDYQHFNNVNWVGLNKWFLKGDLRFHPDNIIFDARTSNITGIIARYDHPKKEWKAGDIVWKIGPDYNLPFDPESRLGQIIGQHHAHIIPMGLPGAGNMLIFDNGGGAGWGPLFAGGPSAQNNTLRNYSRVIEFNPITLEIVWQYSQPNPTADVNGNGKIEGNERTFFSYFISGAQRLMNGNTLITEGATGRVFEVTRKNEIVWEYISPYGGGGSGLGFVGAVYRAYRVPYHWTPIHNY